MGEYSLKTTIPSPRLVAYYHFWIGSPTKSREHNRFQLFLFLDEVGCPRDVMVKAMDFGIVVREFVLQSRYYVHFRANTLGKGMNPLILPAIG